MAGQIRMTPETMRERAGAYDKQGEAVQGVIDQMDSLLEMLLTEWEGSAAEAYNDKYEVLRPGFVKAKELIDDIARSLRASADAIEETDSNIAAAYRG